MQHTVIILAFVTAQVEDNGVPVNTATATVSLSLLDVNEFSPSFDNNDQVKIYVIIYM